MSNGDGTATCLLCGLPSKHGVLGVPSEKEVQDAIAQWLSYRGWMVHSTSQIKASVGSDDGMPDLYCAREGISLWVEVKKPVKPAPIRPSQIAWFQSIHRHESDTLMACVCDDVRKLMEWDGTRADLQESVWPEWAFRKVYSL